jgi:hypothetical protein
MTLSDLASLATVFSGVAVLVSLLYLAQQTRQNTRHTRAMIEQARNRQIIEGEMLYVSDPVVRSLSNRGDAADPNLTEEEVRAYFHLVSSQLMMFEDLFYQHRAGLIDKERNASTISAIRNTRANKPGFRAAWQVCKRGLGQEFQSFVEPMLLEVELQSPRDMTVVWRTLIGEVQNTKEGAG